MMADDQQQPGQQPKIGPGTGTLPSLVPGLPGTESSTLQLKIKNSICKSVQSKVDGILQDVEKFTDIEKLYLYLKLPSGPNSGNEKSEQTSMSSSRTQQTHAFNWICNHLEEHPETSLPKQEVYDEYKSYCDNLGYHPLSAADFGKIMKNVFPNMKARRLGMRGKSKYCYSGLRKRAFVHMPSLPSLDVHKTGDGCEVMDPLGHLSCVEDEVRSAACGLVCEWAQKVLSRQFDTVEDLARFLVNSHYIGTKSAAALTVLTGSPTGSKMPTQSSAFVPTAESHSFQPQVKTLPSPSDAKQQLQRKIQRRQQEQKLQSPLPGDVHGRRADGGTPGAGTGIPCGSPALLSPQPTIGIVVAAVPSPITVQRGRQPMTSPSPVPMGAAEGKVLPVNFQVVTQSVQPVKQCPKTPQNVPASPVGDRAARGHRYAQILPKPSATSALTLRSPPALLITNSSIKTVMPTSQVSSVNVVKMTTISLGVGNNGSSTTTTTTTSSAMRPASAGLSGAGQGDEPTPVPRVRSGSLAALRCPVARSGQITMTLNKMDTEAIADGGRVAGDAGRPTVSQEATGGEPRPGAGVPKPRAASVPTLLAKGSAGLCAMTGTKCNGRTLLHGTTVAAGSNNNTNTNESTLYPNVSIQSTSNTPLTSGLTAVASEGGLLSKIPRKRLGLCPESSPTPVKKAFISQMPAGGPEGPKPVNSAGGKKEDRSGTPVRPESAPAAAAGKVTVKLNCTVPTRILAHSESPAGNTGFQTVVRPRSISQGRWEESVSDAECRAVVTRTVSAPPNQALLQQHMVKTSNLAPAGSNQINLCAAGEMKSALWRGGLPEGTQQQQQAYAQQGAAEHKQIPMSVVEHHPAMSQPSAANQLAQMHAHMVEYTASQPNAGYFPFNDDDMTQDSIVEELVQMEEQMKMNRSVQSFGSCVDITLQGQQTPVQNAVMSTHQSGTPYYSSAHSSSTPIHTPTPTPTPTPTSEMMGGRDPTRESPCSRLAPATPVDSALGSSRQTPIGTPHSSCSSGVPPSPVECRNPFAFTPINSSITGYHDGSIVSSSPVKPMQRPTATHPDKAKLDWMNNGYNSSCGSSSNGISILPSYQDLVDDHFRKPHAFAIPGQSYQSQTRHHDTHISRLTPISPVQQQVGGMGNLTKQEGFAVPAPLDNKTSTSSPGSGTFRCRSVSPAERQRNLSGSHHPNIPHTVVSPFNSPVTPEVLNIFANSHTDASASSMAQRSQSVPLNVMMQTEVLPMQAGQPNGKNITNVLLSKLDGDGDTSLRGLGINNMPSNYTARMNLTQILETSAPSFPGSAGHQALISPSPLGYEFQKPGYHVKNRGETSFSVEESQERSGSVQQMTPQQLIGQHLGQQAVHQQLAEQQLKQQQLVQQPQNQVLLLQQHDLQQHQHHQPMDFNSTVKDLLSQDGVSSGPQPMGQVSELNAMGADLQSDMRLTSELSNSINDLNSLDANLLFDPAQQQGQYEDSTLEELNNDPLFQQICSETVNSAGFDWLESKDQTTVEMLGS